MSEHIILSVTFVIGVAIIAGAAIHCWFGWLALKTHELKSGLEAGKISSHGQKQNNGAGGSTTGAARIEIADLKERIRRLEAIANGVDL